jgi:hypothetical protein
MAPPGNLPKILHDIRAEWVTQPMPVSWPSVPVGVYWPDTPVTCRDLMRFDNGVMGYFAESHRDPSIKSPAERLMCATDDKAINSANYGFADPRRVLEGLDTEFDKHASGDHDKRSILNAYILLTRLPTTPSASTTTATDANAPSRLRISRNIATLLGCGQLASIVSSSATSFACRMLLV